MGYRFVTLDPVPDSPAGQVADRQIVASYSDPIAGEQLAAASDVIVYEFENVDVEVVKRLEDQVFLPQGSLLLLTSQNRVKEKASLTAAGIPVAPYSRVSNLSEVRQAAEKLGYPCVLKTATGGYDGKGQRIIDQPEEIETAWSNLFVRNQEYILESFVPFQKELSVVVARNGAGEISAFPVAENIHYNHILHLSLVPARIDPEVRKRAEALASEVADRLKVIGIVAVEMFLLPDGELLVNELAPRPHNSGHYTFDACKTSQFEQMIRAVCGLPLGSPELLSPVVMVNVLGEHLPQLMERLPHLSSDVKIHFYGKHEARQGRKMGHLTLLADSVDEAITAVNRMGIWETK